MKPSSLSVIDATKVLSKLTALPHLEINGRKLVDAGAVNDALWIPGSAAKIRWQPLPVFFPDQLTDPPAELLEKLQAINGRIVELEERRAAIDAALCEQVTLEKQIKAEVDQVIRQHPAHRIQATSSARRTVYEVHPS